MESEAFEDIAKGADALRTVKDLAAGAAGGMAQVLLGMSAQELRSNTGKHPGAPFRAQLLQILYYYLLRSFANVFALF